MWNAVTDIAGQDGFRRAYGGMSEVVAANLLRGVLRESRNTAAGFEKIEMVDLTPEEKRAWGEAIINGATKLLGIEKTREMEESGALSVLRPE
ncbi:MAG: hypothetical protein J4432_00455 [DPANN group archaeon]|nr:hypothetical protein [DPANN group archaeon]